MWTSVICYLIFFRLDMEPGQLLGAGVVTTEESTKYADSSEAVGLVNNAVMDPQVQTT